MSLDPDLQALSDKIDRLSGLGDKAQFSPEQQGLLDKAADLSVGGTCIALRSKLRSRRSNWGDAAKPVPSRPGT